MASDFLSVCFQLGMFALVWALSIGGYAWLVTP